MKRTVRRIRKKTRNEPDVPTDNGFELPEAFRFTSDGSAFLVADNNNAANRIIIFAADWALDLLEESMTWGVCDFLKLFIICVFRLTVLSRSFRIHSSSFGLFMHLLAQVSDRAFMHCLQTSQVNRTSMSYERSMNVFHWRLLNLSTWILSGQKCKLFETFFQMPIFAVAIFTLLSHSGVVCKQKVIQNCTKQIQLLLFVAAIFCLLHFAQLQVKLTQLFLLFNFRCSRRITSY